MSTVIFRGTPGEVRGRLQDILQALVGRGSPTRQVEVLWRILGLEALAIIRENYVRKGRGETGSDGIRWDPLSPRYLAYKRRHGPALARRRAYARRVGRPGRPLLTADQDRIWRGIFVSASGRLRGEGVDPREAASLAAALAWNVLKRMGANTILRLYGTAPAEIGRDTGRLLASLGPGHHDNVLRGERGVVICGTNVEYARHFHARRPIWPEADRMGPEWSERIGNVLRDALDELLRNEMRKE